MFGLSVFINFLGKVMCECAYGCGEFVVLIESVIDFVFILF